MAAPAPSCHNCGDLHCRKEAMAFKPNYNQQRAERMRAKQAKQEAKRLTQEQQKAERRRALEAGETPPPETAEPEVSEPDDEKPDA